MGNSSAKRLLMLFFIFALSNLSASAKTFEIIVLETMPVKAITEHIQSFSSKITSLVHEQNNDVNIHVLKANGDKARAEELLKHELSQYKPDLVFTVATLASQAGYKVLKGTGIPMVFAVVAEPVGAGIIEKEGAATGSNVTGRIYTLHSDTKLRIVSDVMKSSHKDMINLGIVYSDYPSSVADVKATIKNSKSFKNINIITYVLPYRKVPEGLGDMLKDVSKGILALEDKVDYWWFQTGALTETDSFFSLLTKESKKPVIMATKDKDAANGALMALFADYTAGGEEIAEIGYDILNGAKAGQIPVVEARKFGFSINITKFIEFGFIAPPGVLRLANGKVY